MKNEKIVWRIAWCVGLLFVAAYTAVVIGIALGLIPEGGQAFLNR